MVVCVVFGMARRSAGFRMRLDVFRFVGSLGKFRLMLLLIGKAFCTGGLDRLNGLGDTDERAIAAASVGLCVRRLRMLN